MVGLSQCHIVLQLLCLCCVGAQALRARLLLVHRILSVPAWREVWPKKLQRIQSGAFSHLAKPHELDFSAQAGGAQVGTGVAISCVVTKGFVLGHF